MLFSVAVLGLLAGTVVAAPTRNATTKPQGAVSKITWPPVEIGKVEHLPTHQASDITDQHRYAFRGNILVLHNPFLSVRLKLTPVWGDHTEQASPRPDVLYLSEEPQRIDMQR
jgi:hypothetical protein